MHRLRKAFCNQVKLLGCKDAIKQIIKAVFCFRLGLMHSLVLALGLLFFSGSFIGDDGFAADISYMKEGHKCSHIKDRVQRLLCFDDLFKSTLEQPQIEKAPEIRIKAAGPMRLMATVLEEQRAPGEKNWIMRVRPWRETMLLTPYDHERGFTGRHTQGGRSAPAEWNAQSVDIFMTMKEETDAHKERAFSEKAILMLSCENDITTLGVLLPKPITTLQANLSLSAGNGSTFKLNWRDVENGDVVIAGRGLESIDTIKTIANYERVLLQVTYPEGPRSFVFDMHDLKDRLKPLRTACHW